MTAYRAAREVASTIALWLVFWDLGSHVLHAVPRVVLAAIIVLP